MDYLISIIIGIIIGIFPSHFLVNKLFPEGNSNNLKTSIIITILLDIVKGLLLISITKLLFGFDFLNILLALLFGVLSHSFYQGFKFQRSESLTVTLSGLLLIVPLLVLVWIGIWIISFVYKRDINFSLPSATFLTGLLAVTSANIFNNDYWYTYPVARSDKEFIILIGLLFIVVINSQINRIKSYFFKGKTKDS